MSEIFFNEKLNGKKILLLIPPFYEYHLLIKKELEDQGAEVEMVLNNMNREDFRSSTNYFLTFLFLLMNPFYKKKNHKKIMQELAGKHFDVFFAINGFSVSKELINELKKRNNRIKTVIFFWDSFCYWKYSNLIPLFDYKWSFDRKDCDKYKNQGLCYHPDFYINTQDKAEDLRYDISCITSLSPFTANRLKLISNIQDQCKKLKLKTYLRVYYPTLNPVFSIKTIIKLLINRIDRQVFFARLFKQYDFLIDQKIPMDEVGEIEKKSKTVLDIPPDKQNGLTIRSLEAIASGKKLITTNAMVLKESFYKKENILLINKINPTLEEDFFNEKQIDVNIEHLKLNNWVKSVLSFA